MAVQFSFHVSASWPAHAPRIMLYARATWVLSVVRGHFPIVGSKPLRFPSTGSLIWVLQSLIKGGQLFISTFYAFQPHYFQKKKGFMLLFLLQICSISVFSFSFAPFSIFPQIVSRENPFFLGYSCGVLWFLRNF